jgi:hypothetical protein
MVVVVVTLITVPSGSVRVVVLVLVLLLVELVVTGVGGGTAVVVEEEQPSPKAGAAMIAVVKIKSRSFILKRSAQMKRCRQEARNGIAIRRYCPPYSALSCSSLLLWAGLILGQTRSSICPSRISGRLR